MNKKEFNNYCMEHAEQSTHTACELCDNNTDLNDTTLEWDIYHTLGDKFRLLDYIFLVAGLLGLPYVSKVSTYTCFHKLCLPCANKIKSKRIISSVSYFFAFFFFIISLLPFIFSLFLVIFPQKPKIFDYPELNIFLVCTGVFLVITFLMVKSKYLGVPSFVKSFARPPYILSNVKLLQK
jgi:hypothetical protein